MSAPDPESSPPSRRAPMWVVVAIGAAIAALVIANNVGNAYFSRWITEHPLRLISLNATNKFLLLTANRVDFWPFLIVPTIRLMLPDPLFYALGAIYRERALHWARRTFPGSGALFDSIQQGDGSAARVMQLLVVIAPNNPVCLAAGAAGMPIAQFVVLNVIGTVGRVLLLERLAWLLRDQIGSITETITEYQSWLFPISIALVLGYLAWQVMGERGLVGGVETLREELQDDTPGDEQAR